MFNHSPERDEEVFKEIKEKTDEDYLSVIEIDREIVAELAAIAKKWRAKATMRAARIEELETIPPVDTRLQEYYAEVVEENKRWKEWKEKLEQEKLEAYDNGYADGQYDENIEWQNR